MKSNVTKFFKKTKAVVGKHSPEILVGIGLTGMVTSTILAVKATPKALDIIEEAKREKKEELSKKEIVKATWKCYAPAAASAVVSAACIVGASSVNAKRNAALATAYKLSETAFNEYRDKVVETIGEKKEAAVKEKIVKEKLENNPVDNKTVIVTDKGNTLCYDAISGRYFRSDMATITSTVNELNRQMTVNMNGYISLNDFYDELGLSTTQLGNELGWNLETGLIDIEFDSMIAQDGSPCIVISYRVEPRYDYHKFMR